MMVFMTHMSHVVRQHVTFQLRYLDSQTRAYSWASTDVNVQLVNERVLFPVEYNVVTIQLNWVNTYNLFIYDHLEVKFF